MKSAPFPGPGRILRLPLAVGFLAAAAAAFAVKVGDTYAQVIAEKGKPPSKIDGGSVQVLSYADAVIKLKDGVVVSVRAQVAQKPSQAPKAAPAAAAPNPGGNLAIIEANKQKLEATVAQVVEIINQPVPTVPRTPDMDVWGMEFHPGATRPDFGSVDVRKTQGDAPHTHMYTVFDAHPEVVCLTSDIEFNSMTKYFYMDRTVAKKRLTEEEMVEVNRLYRIIATCELRLAQAGYTGTVP